MYRCYVYLDCFEEQNDTYIIEAQFEVRSQNKTNIDKWDEIPIIDLFSDGGAEPNPGNGGYGIILSWKGKRKEFSQEYNLTPNNRMELLGVITGLEKLKTKSIVNLYTDSRYVIDGIEKGWAEKWKSNNWYRNKKEKANNIDLWSRLLDLISKNDVTF